MARPTEVEKLLERLLKEQKNSNEVLEQLTEDSESRESRESRRPVKSVKPTLFVTGKRASQSDYIAARGAMATEKYTKAYLADLKGQKKKNKKAGVDNKKAEEKKDKAEAKRFKEQINMQEDMIDAINGGFDSMNGEEQSRYDRESKRAASAAKKKLRQEKEDRAKAKEERGFLDKWIGDTKDAFTDKIDEVVTNIDKTTKIKLRKTKAEQQEEAQELRRRSEDMLDKMASTSESQMTRSEKAFAKLIKDNDYNFDGISNDMIDIFEKLGDKLQENDDRFKAKWGKDRDELAKKLNKDFGDILKSENTEQIKEFIAKNKELNDSIQKSIQRDYEAEQELNASFEVFGEGSKAQEKLLNLIMEDSAKQSQTMKDYLDFIRQAHDVEVVEAEEARKQSESNTKAITDASRESTEDIIDVLVDGDESEQDRHLALTETTKTSSAVVVKKMDESEKKEDERHKETMEAEAEVLDDQKSEFRDNFLKRKHELKLKEESLTTLQLILKKLGVCCVGGSNKSNKFKNQTKTPKDGSWLSGVLGMGAGLLLMKKLLPKLMSMKVVKSILSKFGLGKVVGGMVEAFSKISVKTLALSTLFGSGIKIFTDLFKGAKEATTAAKGVKTAVEVGKAAKAAKPVTEAIKVAKGVQKAPKVVNSGAKVMENMFTKNMKPSLFPKMDYSKIANNTTFRPVKPPKLTPKIAKSWIGKQTAKYTAALDDLTAKMMKNINVPKWIPKKVAEKMVRKEAGKILVKKIPIFGLLLSGGLAAADLADGKMDMAGLQIASGISSIFAGPGTAASFGFDAAYMYKMFDNYKEEHGGDALEGSVMQGEKGKAVLTSSPVVTGNNNNVYKKPGTNALAGAYEFNKKNFENVPVVGLDKNNETLEEVRDELKSLNAKEKEKAQKLKEAEAKAKADKSVVDPKEKISEDQKKKKEEAKSTLEKARDWSLSALKKAGEKAKAAYKSTMESMGVAIDWAKDGWNGTGNGSAGPDKYGNYDVGTGKYGSSSGTSSGSYGNFNGGGNGNVGVDRNSSGERVITYPSGEKKVGGHRNWRNNNPGNIRSSQFTDDNGSIGNDGAPGVSGKFAIFPTMEAGFKAQTKLITQGKNYKNLSLADAIKRYAPPSENNTQAYISAVVKATGISPNTVMGTLTEKQGLAVAHAMANVEGTKAGRIEKSEGKLKQEVKNSIAGNGSTGNVSQQMTSPKESFLPAPKGGPLASAVPTMSSASDAMGPRNTLTPSTTTIGAVGSAGYSEGGNNAANFAKQFKGKFAYSMARRGQSVGGVDYLDCSLFVQKVIRGTGIDKKFPSTTSTQVPYLRKKVQSGDKSVIPIGTIGELKAGDLIYFMNNAHHVVMMASDNSIIHSSSTHNNVVEVPSTYLTSGWGSKHLSDMFRYTNEGEAVDMKGKTVGEMSGSIKSSGGGNGAGVLGGSSSGGSSSGVSTSGGGAGAGFTEGGSTGKVSSNPAYQAQTGMGDLAKKFGGGQFGSNITNILGDSPLGKMLGGPLASLATNGLSGITNSFSSILGKSSIGGQLSQTLGNMDSLPFNGLMNQLNSSKNSFNTSMLTSNNSMAQGLNGISSTLGNMTGTGPGATIPFTSGVSDSSLDILRGMLGGS